MDTLFYAAVILVFATFVLLVEAAYIWWRSNHSSEAKRMQQRLRLLSGEDQTLDAAVSILKRRFEQETGFSARVLALIPSAQKLEQVLAQSGLGWSFTRLLGTSAGVALFFVALSWLMGLPLLLCLLCGLLTACLPLMYVAKAREKRLVKFEVQLPEAADLIGRSLRAGHAFPSALSMVGAEMSEPIAGEFRMTFDEINYGISMNDALQHLAERVPVTDLRFFVIAVLIQRESGGNLAEILASISKIIRDRLKLLSQVRVLSAEGKMSAWVLGLLPIGVGTMISIINPKYISALITDSTGRMLLSGAIGLMLLGAVWMRKIIRIRV